MASYMDDVIKGISAYGSGIMELPQDAVKYPALGANALFNKLGLRSDRDAQLASQQIKRVTNEPAIYPDAVNNYRTWLKRENPEMNFLGQIAGAALTGKSVGAPYMLAKGNKLHRATQAHPIMLGTALGAYKEGVSEPALDAIQYK